MSWGIWLADADGDNPREFIEAGDRESLGAPDWSPDGKRIAYRRAAWTETGVVWTIESRGLDEDTSTVLVRDAKGTSNQWDLANSGDLLLLEDRLVYADWEPSPRNKDQNLWEIAIDPRSGDPRGEPRQLTDWDGWTIRHLSATADGSRLAFRTFHDQSDVYVGQLGDAGRRLDNVRRLTLDDRQDAPVGWSPDGRAVVFTSTRYGSRDLFVQELDRRDAEDLAVGEGAQGWAEPTPDGAFYLYWESSQNVLGWHRNPRRLLRIAVDGGPTELVLETRWPAEVSCATSGDGPCFLGEFLPEEKVVTVSRLDPVAGKGEELWRLDMDAPPRPAALDPAGRRFANTGGSTLFLFDAVTGEHTMVQVDGLDGAGLSGEQAWLPDGSGIYAAGFGVQGAALFRIDLQGKATLMYALKGCQFSSIEPSPDGRHLAFEQRTRESNVWTIDGF